MKLNLDSQKIQQARELAKSITAPVQGYLQNHTTVTIERATLRLFGVDGINHNGIPIPNIIVDKCRSQLGHGISRYYINALLKTGYPPSALNTAITDGLDIMNIEQAEEHYLRERAEELVNACAEKIGNNSALRNEKLKAFAENEKDPWLYAIVASGNIYEDIKQAKAAVFQGADIIAVIRTTAQSLLDFVPFGATTEGFGGTYATQENFRIMRTALDEAGEKERRYIRLVNYCSGLCMPEIAAMGALERLDMMLNDSMYGILFRDINMYRTFIDQNFSRMINAYARIIINTGEDNYLTTSDAVEKAHTVLASQLLNEQFGLQAGLTHELMGLGHAYEIDPSLKNGFLFELAQALMAREIFPGCPLKYMPPTKFMTGNIFKGYAMNTLFNFVSKLTGQKIHLLGMLTEAIHTPYLQDRYLALENAQYVMNTIADLGEEIEIKAEGKIAGRAQQVLNETLEFLQEVQKNGLFESIEKGFFAEIKRQADGGKGLNGVFEKEADYWNPWETFLQKKLHIQTGGAE